MKNEERVAARVSSTDERRRQLVGWLGPHSLYPDLTWGCLGLAAECGVSLVWLERPKEGT